MPDKQQPSRTDLLAELNRLRARVVELERSALVSTVASGAGSERLFHATAQAVSEATGEEFFKRLVEHLARSLGCEFAEIGILVPGQERIRTLAFYGGGRLQENIEYELADTPCQGVVQPQFCIHPQGVQELFPHDAILTEIGAESYAGIPLFGAAGNVLGLICVIDRQPLVDGDNVRSTLQIFASRAAAEIERQQTEQSLRASRRQLEMALVAGHVGIGQWDVATGAIRWSDGLAELLGLGDRALGVPHSLRDLIHPDDLPTLQQRMQAAVEGRAAYRAEFRLKRADGEWIWILTQGEFDRDPQDCPIALTGTILDITERKRFEAELEAGKQALADSERTFRQLAESIRDVFWMFDLAEQRLIYVSPAFETVTQHPVAWIVDDHRRWMDMVYEEDRKRVSHHVRAFEEGGGFDSTYRIARPDGSIRWIHDRRFAVSDADIAGRIAGVAEDITERLEGAEKLQEQAAQLAHVARLSSMGELVASIAHEVNQPLYAIGNFSKAISEGLQASQIPPMESLRKWTAEISKAVNRADAIIRRLRSYVSKGPLQRAEVDVNAVVGESVDLLAFEARRHRAHIVQDLAPALPKLMADPVAIQQVVVNLLRNAFEALRDEPDASREVTLSTRAVAGGVEVAVRDAGAGIAPEDLGRLFTTFYTNKPEGMGMGLAISKTIVEAHQGRIWATHNAHQQGSTFHFVLPTGSGKVGS